MLSFKQNYFIIIVFFSFIFAEIAPWLGSRGGVLAPEITAKYIAVFVIFFISGLTVKLKYLSDALKQLKLQLFIQVISFICIPLFLRFFLFLLSFLINLNLWIHNGLIILGCIPPPMSSVVIFTKLGGGNEATAIFSSALGNCLGIILTPLLLLISVGSSAVLPISATLMYLTETSFIPLLLGQLFQKCIPKKIIVKIQFSTLSLFSLLFIIYSSFCDMFSNEDYYIDAHIFLITVLLIVIIQIILIYSIFIISCHLRNQYNFLASKDVVAVLFCCSQKSLTLGLPFLKTLYSGYSHLSEISLPLILYHPVQLILGGFLVSSIHIWLKGR